MHSPNFIYKAKSFIEKIQQSIGYVKVFPDKELWQMWHLWDGYYRDETTIILLKDTVKNYEPESQIPYSNDCTYDILDQYQN